MTFNEAFKKCERDEWQSLVIQSKEYLGPNAFITYSYKVDKQGKIRKSEGKRFLLMAYTDNDFISIPGPFNISPSMDKWDASVFWVNEEEEFNPDKVVIDDIFGELNFLRTGKRFSFAGLLDNNDFDEYFD